MSKIPKDAIFKGTISQTRLSSSELVEWISDFLHESKTSIKRLLKDGAIEINGKKFLEDDAINHHDILKIGKKLFFRVEIPYFFERWETNDYDYLIYRERITQGPID